MHLPVTTQPYSPDHRDWMDGLFACQNNRKSCFLIAFCYPCYMCHMYSRYEECCATPMCILFPGLVLRTYHRGKHRIAPHIIDCQTPNNNRARYFVTGCTIVVVHYVPPAN
ncbi:putative placenta-specificprotein 8 protein (C15 protein) (Onzin) [Paragonimus skrjabini miyazakii]|uniref:Putative placenta-specificprotein 8 protein (C15 protein) (Onzin) n=1 Tax=Paragonimus skrjabini miyazakii TaxID=59628 RepID=A0A8S9YPG7_9TREM|nr:putative placenta-specificprotein 8 protein (C15 protein) (Onzin) [Paragonimus skrjabini miyazakii]